MQDHLSCMNPIITAPPPKMSPGLSLYLLLDCSICWGKKGEKSEVVKVQSKELAAQLI